MLNNTVGFVPTMYVQEAIFQNMEKRQKSAQRNHKRRVYEEIENNNEFEVMLDDEIRKISRTDRYACRSSAERSR